MTRNAPYPLLTALALATSLLTPLACDGGDGETGETDTGETDTGETSDSDAQAEEDPCVAVELADDALIEPGLGEAGDPANWPALPPDAIVASTYLRLPEGEDARAIFDELMQPILGELMASEGLMGVSTTGSESCNTVRTLTVWASEDAMMQFVTSDAHIAAMGRTADVSRGGSITSHWTVGEFDAILWETVLPRFAEHDGPIY